MYMRVLLPRGCLSILVVVDSKGGGGRKDKKQLLLLCKTGVFSSPLPQRIVTPKKWLTGAHAKGKKGIDGWKEGKEGGREGGRG
jgi:hypothetical protein